jgi:uncharacterized membrane protein HdeD (DUF308 family)
METTEYLKSAKFYIIFEGILAVLLGLAILLVPDLTIETILIFIGFYGVIHGLILVGMGMFAQRDKGHRGLSIAVGAVSILFGLIVLNMPVVYIAFNLYLIAAMIAIQGIYYIIHSFSPKDKESKGHNVMLFIAGVLAVLFALWVVFNPLAGVLLLVFILALTLIISGALAIAAGSSIETKE